VIAGQEVGEFGLHGAFAPDERVVVIVEGDFDQRTVFEEAIERLVAIAEVGAGNSTRNLVIDNAAYKSRVNLRLTASRKLT